MDYSGRAAYPTYPFFESIASQAWILSLEGRLLTCLFGHPQKYISRSPPVPQRRTVFSAPVVQRRQVKDSHFVLVFLSAKLANRKMPVKRILKTLLPLRAQHHIKAIIGGRRAHRILAERRRAGHPVKLEIGAGPVRRQNGLITLDLDMESDICWDLSMPLPFPENSVSLIYSSHVMEHFGYSQLIALLKNCLKSLESGGVFSACVPDASTYIRAYTQTDDLDASYLEYRPAVVSDKKIDIVNYIAYMDGEHKYMFDEENLSRVLTVAGFSKVRIRDFDPAIDLPERRHGSIYVMGVKP